MLRDGVVSLLHLLYPQHVSGTRHGVTGGERKQNTRYSPEFMLEDTPHKNSFVHKARLFQSVYSLYIFFVCRFCYGGGD